MSRGIEDHGTSTGQAESVPAGVRPARTVARSPAYYAELKRRNAELNLAEMRAGEIELRSMPRYVLVELTQGCNLRCPMCRSHAIGYREREMPRSFLAEVVEVLFPTAQMVDIRGWGESLLAPEIDDVIRAVDAHHSQCRVVTNLSFNRPATLDLLADVGAMVDVSLDSVHQDVLGVVRQGARFSTIDRNLRRLAGRYSDAAGHGSLRITATVQRATLAGLNDLVRYSADLGGIPIVLHAVTLSADNPNALTGLDDQVDATIMEAAREAARLGVELYAGSRFGRRVGIKKDIPFCMHPWSYVTVGYDGSVGYCDYLIGPMMQYSCMGDMTVEGFTQIWNGKPWRDLRQWHGAGHLPDDQRYGPCTQCYAHRNVDFEDLFEPRLERYLLTGIPDGQAPTAEATP
jgi:radical SAM protein with 4Fe4S-binding SPASM domain